MTKSFGLLATAALAVVLLLAPGCRPFWKKKPRLLPPTPIPQAQPREPEEVQTPDPPEIEVPADPAVEASPPSIEELGTIQVPPPPRPQATKRGNRLKQPAIAEGPATEVPPAETPPPAPQPRLGEMLAPEELREHAVNIDRSLRECRAMLAQILKHKLTTDQSESVARIQTFLRQAEEARRSDLVAAVNLARRAELLAKDLLDRLR